MKQVALGVESVRSIVVILSLLVLVGAGLPVLTGHEAELSLTEQALGRAAGKWRQEQRGGTGNVRTSTSKRYVPVDENTSSENMFPGSPLVGGGAA